MTLFRFSPLGLALGALILSGPGLAPSWARAAQPVFAAGPCQEDYGKIERAVRCGVLTVDENRDRVGGRRIRLAVVVVKASRPTQGLPPVVFLHGGPGGDFVADLPSRLARLTAGGERDGPIAVDQDWIFFDQRGVGRSEPAMDCPGAPLTDAGPPSEAAARALVACLDGFADQGLDLSRYNAAETARDVQDLRLALGLPRIDLYGVSYGTRIAAAALTHAPEGVRAVIQDSPWPPEARWAAGGPEMVVDAVSLILKKCALQVACANRHPRLRERLETLARTLLDSPRAWRGQSLTADDLGGYLMDAAYFEAGDLPRELERLASGDLEPIAAFTRDREYYFEGAFMTHLCREEMPFERRAEVGKKGAADPLSETVARSMRRLFDVCAATPITPAGPIEARPVKTAVPTLFIAAEIDPGCPPRLARAAARGYRASRLVIVPNATHGVGMSSPCARRMVRAFLRNPAGRLDLGCLPPPQSPLRFSEQARR